MSTEELIVNAIVFVAGWILKRPAIVEAAVAKLFAKKSEAKAPETPKKGK
jgi:hypothetical protein